MYRKEVTPEYAALLSETGFPKIRIYLFESDDFVGTHSPYKKEVEINSNLDKMGFTIINKKFIILHELGHEKHNTKHTVLGFMHYGALFVSTVSGFLVALFIILALLPPYSFEHLAFRFGEVMALLIFSEVFLSIAYSLDLFREDEADSYAESFLRKKGIEGIRDETTKLIAGYNPTKPSILRKIRWLFFPRNKELECRLTRKCIYIPFIGVF